MSLIEFQKFNTTNVSKQLYLVLSSFVSYLHVSTVKRSELGGVDVAELSNRPQQLYNHRHMNITSFSYVQ